MIGSPGRLFPYATSHRIEEVGDGLLRKDLAPDALIGQAAQVKLSAEHDPRREPAVYRALLGPAGIGPRCVESGQDWIIIERIEAPVLWQIGDAATWVAVAGWCASMHRALADRSPNGLPLARHDRASFADARVRARARGVPAHVLNAHRRASERLGDLATTTIHGELYASNVLVEAGHHPADVRVWPIDWELAAIGPVVLDVAALTAGWPVASPVRIGMIRAYFEAMGGHDADWPGWCHDVRAAQLHLCVHWLGSPHSWSPPDAHRHDWLTEADELATQC